MNGCSYYCCCDYWVSHFQVVFNVVIITCLSLQNKNELQTGFQMYYIIANENCFMQKKVQSLLHLNKACM